MSYSDSFCAAHFTPSEFFTDAKCCLHKPLIALLNFLQAGYFVATAKCISLFNFFEETSCLLLPGSASLFT